MDNKTIIGVLSAVAVILIGIIIYQRYCADAQSFVAGAPVRIIGVEYKQNKDVNEIAQLAQRVIDAAITEQYVDVVDNYLRMLINETRDPKFKPQWNSGQQFQFVHELACGDIRTLVPGPNGVTLFDEIKNIPDVTPEMLDAAVKLNIFIRKRFCVNGITDAAKIIVFLKAIRASIPNAKPFNEEAPITYRNRGRTYTVPMRPVQPVTVQPVTVQPVTVQPAKPQPIVMIPTTQPLDAKAVNAGK
jgi:hypothetical protein